MMANRQVFGLSFCATPSIYAIKIGLQTPLTVTKPSDCADESFQKNLLYMSAVHGRRKSPSNMMISIKVKQKNTASPYGKLLTHSCITLVPK